MEIEWAQRIDPEKRRHALHAALSFATATLLLFVLVGLFFPPLWACLITISVPLFWHIFADYRTMRRTPNKLKIHGDQLIFLMQGTPSFSIPLTLIGRVEMGDGIKVYTKGKGQITVLNNQFSLSKFLAQSRAERCDLFFPGFDLSVKTLLQDIVHANQSYDPSPF